MTTSTIQIPVTNTVVQISNASGLPGVVAVPVQVSNIGIIATTLSVNVPTNQTIVLGMNTVGPQGTGGSVGPIGPVGPAGSVGPVGPVGPPGPTQPLFYTHTQATPSASWVINHNLNGYPTVVVFDSAGTQCEGSFSYTSLNQMVITYSSAFSGLAYVI